MKKLLNLFVVFCLGMIITTTAFASEDWRDLFISKNSAKIMDELTGDCFLTKPDDLPDYVYAFLFDDSKADIIQGAVNGDAKAIEDYKEFKRSLDLVSAGYYGNSRAYNSNSHFAVIFMNPLVEKETLYITVDGVQQTDNLTIPTETTPTESTEPASTESYDLDLSAGHYYGGLGIPTGTYNITLVSGRGNVYSPLKINEIFGEDQTREFNNFVFGSGVELKISGSLIVHIHTDNANYSNLKQRVIENEVETILAPGQYTAGTDFPEGTYFITAYEESGNIHSYEAGVNEIISTEPDDHSIYQYNYATFKTGDPLEVSSCTVKLVPAGD